MSQQQEQLQPEDGQSVQKDGPQQQENSQSSPDGHGGQGSDSAMKQMRIWEQDRTSHSGGKRRQGPG